MFFKKDAKYTATSRWASMTKPEKNVSRAWKNFHHDHSTQADALKKKYNVHRRTLNVDDVLQEKVNQFENFMDTIRNRGGIMDKTISDIKPLVKSSGPEAKELLYIVRANNALRKGANMSHKDRKHIEEAIKGVIWIHKKYKNTSKRSYNCL